MASKKAKAPKPAAPPKGKRLVKRTKRLTSTGRTPRGPNNKMLAPEEAAKALQQQKMAADLKIRGMSYQQIADVMGTDTRAVKRLVQRALEEYYDSHTEVVQRYVGIQLARYDVLMKTWMPKALGGQRKEKVTDPMTGTEVEKLVTLEPDPVAAKITLDGMRDQNRFLGNGQAARFEHTGSEGGPIRYWPSGSSGSKRA